MNSITLSCVIENRPNIKLGPLVTTIASSSGRPFNMSISANIDIALFQYYFLLAYNEVIRLKLDEYFVDIFCQSPDNGDDDPRRHWRHMLLIFLCAIEVLEEAWLFLEKPIIYDPYY